jgi:MFS family permease
LSTEAPAPRTFRSLLLDRNYGPFLVGKTLSSSAVWAQNMAAAVLMYQLTRSAFMVGLVSTLQFLPTALLALYAGVLTDQFDRRRLLMLGRATSGVAMGGLAIMIIVRGVEGFGGPPALLFAMGVSGVGWAISAPSMQALIPAIVEMRDLEPALAANAAVPSIARSVGPVLGSGLLLLGGPPAAFGAAAAGHLLLGLILVFIRTRPVKKPQGRPTMLGGLRYLVKDRYVALLIIGVAFLNFGAEPVMTLSPSIADGLGVGDQTVGYLVSSFGIGAIFMTLGLRSVRSSLSLRQTSHAGYLIAAVGLVIVAFSMTLSGALAGFFINGLGFMMATVAVNTRIQQRIPESVRGRVMAIWSLAFLGLRPVAALLNGWMADQVGVRSAILTSAAIAVLAAQFTRVRPTEVPEFDG